MPTVYLETDDGLRLPILVVGDIDSDGIELLAATIGAIAEEAPAVAVTVADELANAVSFDSPELQAVHEVVEWAVLDAGLPIEDHMQFDQRAEGTVTDTAVTFRILTVVAGDLVGRFHLADPGSEQFASGMPKDLRAYWLGGDGATKIGWGTKGAFTRCVGYLREYVDDPEGTCANLYRDATGRWPGQKHAAAVDTEGFELQIVEFAEPVVTVDDLVGAAEAADRIRAGKRTAVTPANAVLVVEALADDVEQSDLTLMTVIGQGVFGAVARNSLARDDMPQIPAQRLEAFRGFLAERGVATIDMTVDPVELSATQNQLDGRKTGKFVRSIRTGAMRGVPLWAARDGNLLDGHHRWAAETLLSLGEEASQVPVVVVDLSIARTLDMARRFNGVENIASKQHGMSAI